MKNYTAPQIDILLLDACDIITASFGNLDSLPNGDDTPIEDLGGGRVDW